MVPGTQESFDMLSLPQDRVTQIHDLKMKTHVQKELQMPNDSDEEDLVVTHVVEPNVIVLNDEVQTKTWTKGSCSSELEIAIKERDEAQASLSRLERTLGLQQYAPATPSETSWLVWVHQLLDKEELVNGALKELRKRAVQSDDSCEVVHSSLERLKGIASRRGATPTSFTSWGDMDVMFERLNHSTKGRLEDIKWELDLEEGWIPYNTFSSHMRDEEKVVIHACDPGAEFLNNKCCLCQGHFGPEGALTLGQCRHTYHSTCIAQHSLSRASCPECRSPLSRRFYEMLGLLHMMPSGHEYNRWNLPLDQGPKEFLNHHHWGSPLVWNLEKKCHDLYLDDGEVRGHVDPLFWMTQDHEVELRARTIESLNDRELFCRNFGGHWSEDHKRFFRFPGKKVEKVADGTWQELEDEVHVIEEYAKYDRNLIGRALVLSKLEEAAKIRIATSEEGFKSSEYSWSDVVQAFDKRIGEAITYWKNGLLTCGEGSSTATTEYNDIVSAMVIRVEKAVRALVMEEIDVSPRRKLKRKANDVDEYSPEIKRQMNVVDREVEAGGKIMNPSQKRVTRSSAKDKGQSS